MTKDISNKTLATLLIVAIAISIIGTFITVNRPIQVAGLATSETGEAPIEAQDVQIENTENIPDTGELNTSAEAGPE